jgi:hypothetical protein
MENNQMGFAPVTGSTAGAPMTETEMGGTPTEEGGWSSDWDDEDDYPSDWDNDYEKGMSVFGIIMIILLIGGAIFAVIWFAFPDLFKPKSDEEDLEEES